MAQRSVAMTVLYRNRKTGQYLLQHNCRHPTGAYTDYGPPEPISNEQFQQQLSALIFQSLEAFDDRRFGDVPYRAPEGFERRHDEVSVALLENRSVEISAGQRTRGGYEAPIVATVSEEEARSRMTELIEAAFARTS